MKMLKIAPVGKPRMTYRDRWGTNKRPAVIKYHKYCDDLRAALGDSYVLPTALFIRFHLPMPKTWSKKKREATIGRPHDQKPDIDNLAKGFMDAFKTEDKHVFSLQAEKYWAEDGFISLRVD